MPDNIDPDARERIPDGSYMNRTFERCKKRKKVILIKEK